MNNILTNLLLWWNLAKPLRLRIAAAIEFADATHEEGNDKYKLAVAILKQDTNLSDFMINWAIELMLGKEKL